ncbi:MAG: RdgB/HAM1 family non-canonical purine NTP pyrophosphatase [Pelagibacterales bacterium]|nr:RdgB/HAM1 family non-canonical purine NTP pyrophosphatase [Pelagibacterales bacterium]
MKLPKEILIASGNAGKVVEISQLLEQLNIKGISAANFNIIEPEETGLTFADNSLLKAKFYSSKTNLFTLADDSGLCIEDLNGDPGIYSARWAINEEGKKDFNYAFDQISKAFKKNGKSFEKAKSHFICNLTLFDPKTNFSISFEGRVDGFLTFPAKGNKGFGYDPIFIKEGMTETFGEIDPKLKDQISHRADAFKKMVEWLKSV